jgi:Flp pilus assembly protein TadB
VKQRNRRWPLDRRVRGWWARSPHPSQSLVVEHAEQLAEAVQRWAGMAPLSVLACVVLGQRRDQYLAEQLEAALQVRVWAVLAGEGLGDELELVVTEWGEGWW